MYDCEFRVVKYILTRRGGSKSLNMSHSRRAGFSNSDLPEKLWKNHANMLSDALAFRKTYPLRGMSFQ